MRKKIELENIIGIVKTDEVTNSVELKKEVYNDAEKQFKFNKSTVATNLKTPIVYDGKKMSVGEVLDKLNELHEENLKLNDENEKLKKGMIRVVDRYIKNVECNPLSYAQPYRKVKRTLNNIREDLRSLIGDVE